MNLTPELIKEIHRASLGPGMSADKLFEMYPELTTAQWYAITVVGPTRALSPEYLAKRMHRLTEPDMNILKIHEAFDPDPGPTLRQEVNRVIGELRVQMLVADKRSHDGELIAEGEFMAYKAAIDLLTNMWGM